MAIASQAFSWLSFFFSFVIPLPFFSSSLNLLVIYLFFNFVLFPFVIIAFYWGEPDDVLYQISLLRSSPSINAIFYTIKPDHKFTMYLFVMALKTIYILVFLVG
jgi:hypothetical protein